MILILGRFQPLHNGHMKVIRDSLAEDDDLVIAIGSPGKSDQKMNPFSGEERKEMLERTLKARNIAAEIFFVPDRPSDEGYVGHVIEQIGRKPDKIITENPWTIDLFGRAGYKVVVTERHFELSSTEIRNRISKGREWEHLVPEEVAEFINGSRGIERIKRTQTEYQT
ncbi:nicotinamide-nucleotide adenylyltransferase [Candidatus Woesearchaeota archaeon]|nr:nicotinamide-nucleotide adenylyltransferase [Candidatus Woesearchaeota archaeon]